MAKTDTITLDDKEYTIHRFNLGELEDIADITAELSPRKAAFAVLAMALKRADPVVADEAAFKALECTQDEITEAMTKIMKLSGMKLPNPAAASATEPAQA